MAQLDLGKVTLTDDEITQKILNVNSNIKFGKDEDGNVGYIVTDAETGADTVIPFKKSGGLGLPIQGQICFSGTQIYSLDQSSVKYFLDYFKEGVDISDINEIKVITNIDYWAYGASGYKSNLQRNIKVVELVKNKTNGNFGYVFSGNILYVSGTNNGVLINKEDIFNRDNYSTLFPSGNELYGIGVSIYQYGGGSSNAYWFKSTIASSDTPDKAKMEYIIS